jgi:hypothetical protein
MTRRVPILRSDQRIGSQKAHDADLQYFQTHPEAQEYIRDLIPGESPEPMPPGTRVVVRRFRVGNVEQRARAFLTPDCEVN